MTALSLHPPGTIHGELLELLLATCVDPRSERCRYCGGENDGIHASIFFDQEHTRCHRTECHEKHKSLVHAVLVELAGSRCFCAAMKREKTTFCTRCYHKLPLVMRNSLYAHIGSGYLENYADARKFLAEHKPPTRPSRQEGIAA